MGVYFRRLDVGMSHQLLDHPDVDAVFKQVGGKTVSEGMTPHRLENPRFFNSGFSPLSGARIPGHDGVLSFRFWGLYCVSLREKDIATPEIWRRWGTYDQGRGGDRPPRTPPPDRPDEAS